MGRTVFVMLKRFWGELESEAAADEKIYKKLKCRCNTNDRETTSAIDSGRQLDMHFTCEILDKTGASAKISTGAKNLQSDIASKQQPLDEATALRKKQLAPFTQEEKMLLEAKLSLLRSWRGLFAMVGSLSPEHFGFIGSAIQVRDQGVGEAPHRLCANASRGEGV